VFGEGLVCDKISMRDAQAMILVSLVALYDFRGINFTEKIINVQKESKIGDCQDYISSKRLIGLKKKFKL